MVPAPPPHLGTSDEDLPGSHNIGASQAFIRPLSTNDNSANTACGSQILNGVGATGVASENASHRPVRAARNTQYRSRKDSDEYLVDTDEGERNLSDVPSVARAWRGRGRITEYSSGAKNPVKCIACIITPGSVCRAQRHEAASRCFECR
jgi:hypothetical protein